MNRVKTFMYNKCMRVWGCAEILLKTSLERQSFQDTVQEEFEKSTNSSCLVKAHT